MNRSLLCAAVIGGASLGIYAQPIVVNPPSVPQQRSAVIGLPPDSGATTVAVTLDARGSCKFSTDGKTFRPLKKGQELSEGAIVRTGRTGKADLFLKRMATTVRIKGKSEITLSQSELADDERHEVNTTVDVEKGKILTVVHGPATGSSLNIKNATGKTLSDATVGGRYLISATEIREAGPEQLPAGGYNAKMAAAIKEQMEFDELTALSQAWSDPNAPQNAQTPR